MKQEHTESYLGIYYFLKPEMLSNIVDLDFVSCF